MTDKEVAAAIDKAYFMGRRDGLRDGFSIARKGAEISVLDDGREVNPYIDWYLADLRLQEALEALDAIGGCAEGRRDEDGHE